MRNRIPTTLNINFDLLSSNFNYEFIFYIWNKSCKFLIILHHLDCLSVVLIEKIFCPYRQYVLYSLSYYTSDDTLDLPRRANYWVALMLITELNSRILTLTHPSLTHEPLSCPNLTRTQYIVPNKNTKCFNKDFRPLIPTKRNL